MKVSVTITDGWPDGFAVSILRAAARKRASSSSMLNGLVM